LPKSKLGIWKIDSAFVEEIHDVHVSILWPGTDPVQKGECRDRGLLESAVNRPFQSAFGEDAYPNTLEKAAALFQSLIANHPFANGNKRTAVLALQVFLVANSYAPAFTYAQMYELARQTASYKARGISHKQSLEEIVGFLGRTVASFYDMRMKAKENRVLQRGYRRMTKVRRILQSWGASPVKD
jgi:death-on-curing protein